MQFYSLTVTQFEDLSSIIDGDDKLDALETFPLTLVRRREKDEPINQLERSSFMSINRSM